MQKPEEVKYWSQGETVVVRNIARIDSPAHQARVKAAGLGFIRRFERGDWPFSSGWENWQPPEKWRSRQLPQDWASDFGSHKLFYESG